MSHWTRPGTIYRAVVLHPQTGKRCTGYVGKTRRRVQTRWHEHEHGFRDPAGRWHPPQPWRDTVLEWQVVRSWRNVTTLELAAAEVATILLERPLYNYRWNRMNSRRIPIYVAKRRERSAAFYAALHRPQ